MISNSENDTIDQCFEFDLERKIQEWKKITTVRIKFNHWKLNVMDKAILEIIGNLNNITDITIDIISELKNSDENLLEILPHIFQGVNKFKRLSVNLSFNKITDKSAKVLFSQYLSKMENLEGLSLDFTFTNITDQSIKALSESCLNIIKNLVSFNITFSYVPISDVFFSELFIEMPKIEYLRISCSNTRVSNQTAWKINKLVCMQGKTLRTFVACFDETGMTERYFYMLSRNVKAVFSQTYGINFIGNEYSFTKRLYYYSF